jgi:1-aminocyclopropane-1-carboxylate deaminase/D-cysteine desulfhydrase-like pyridoxal-dependent ACC family enzyme
MDAVKKVAQWEGLLLDPIYMAKPAAALLEDAPGYEKGDCVVLLYTGGSPNLFAHEDQIAEYL